MKIAVAGCAHGNIDYIYHSLRALEKQDDVKVSLLIICGDMLTVRNPPDIGSMTLPITSRTVVSPFYKYYSGARIAPVLTIFVGGIYEVINYTSELPYGGWVCPNIYYMGHANVLNVGGLRIAGLSGIFNEHDYRKGHFEYPPYNNFTLSALHVRSLEIFRLLQVERPIDIFVSHEWPTGMYHYGNKKAILSYKPSLGQYMEKSSLGSPASAVLLKILKPSYWFAAGLHCKFTASLPHNNTKRPKTEFVAFDKCLPGRQFLQIFDINSKFKEGTKNGNGNIQIEYDPEWLGILRNTNHLLNVSILDTVLPDTGVAENWDMRPISSHLEIVQDFQNDFKVPENFCVTAPTYSRFESFPFGRIQTRYVNPQTQKFCQIMKIADPSDAAICIAFLGEFYNFNHNVFKEDISTSKKSTTALGSDDAICSNQEYLKDIQARNVSSIVSDGLLIDTSYQASQSNSFLGANSGATFNSPSSDPKSTYVNFTPQPSCSSLGSNARYDQGTSSTTHEALEKLKSCKIRKNSFKNKFQGQ